MPKEKIERWRVDVHEKRDKLPMFIVEHRLQWHKDGFR
jgi:hypothetical protein